MTPKAPLTHPRLRRLRLLARFLDSAIPLPGGYRIGFDGIVGLLPGVGDLAGSLASSYIIIESARLGASTGTLARMVFNVLVDSLIGLIPFLGDLFDFVWKANDKNVQLLEKELLTNPPESTPKARLSAALILVVTLMLAAVSLFAYLLFQLFLRLVAAIHGLA
jgi:hypothetical protein